MKLNEIFKAIAFKKLAMIDIPYLGSNQHEVQGIASVRKFFGTGELIRDEIQWHYFSDEEDVISDTGQITFYDARRMDPDRNAEWRMYYTGDFLAYAEPGDSLYLVRLNNGDVHGLIFPAGSSWERNTSILFNGLHQHATEKYTVLIKDEISDEELEYIKKRILSHLGLDHVIQPEETDKDIITGKFGSDFPSTYEMSSFARSQVEFDPRDPSIDPDEKLIQWISREDDLFRALENIIVQEKLNRGFEDVDDFISYSLSVQNRRKSRMGYAFEHHLKALFDLYSLKYTWQAETERGNKADFIFPGEEEYKDLSFEVKLLVMLGAKSTIKERWRQVLEAADRIDKKHLCTLEPSLSVSLTNKIAKNHIQLVIPDEFHTFYEDQQLENIINLEKFISIVKYKQSQL